MWSLEKKINLKGEYDLSRYNGAMEMLAFELKMIY